ncbi:auxin response factor 6 [Tanacetum coccineum]
MVLENQTNVATELEVQFVYYGVTTETNHSMPERNCQRYFEDFVKQPPAQELIARDLHDNEWKFRHILELRNELLCVQNRVDVNEISRLKVRHSVPCLKRNLCLFSIPHRWDE